MANLLAPSTYNGFNPSSAGNSALPAIGSGIINSLGTPRPVTSIGSFSPTPTISLPSPTMSTVQTGGKTPLGTAVTAPVSAPVKTQPAAAPAVTPATSGTNSDYSFPSMSSANAATGTRSVTLPSGMQAQIDANGNIVNGPQNNFSIDTSGTHSSDAIGSTLTGGDVSNKYAQYLQQLAQAYQLPDSMVSAMNDYNNAKLAGSTIQADFLTNPNYPGDTYGFAQGVEGRQLALNALREQAASNNLGVQQNIYQSRIDAAKALAAGYAPQSVGIGGSLVSGADGSVAYQSPYLFRPTASSVSSLANTLYSTGAAPDINTALNMAQQIVTNQATGQTATNAPADMSQSPVYENAISLLQQGVPFDTVLSQVGRNTGAKAVVQQALNYFMGSNTNYNAAAAKAGYSFRQNAGTQTFQVNAKTALTNIDLLEQISSEMHRTNFPYANWAQLQAAAQTGDPNAAKLLSVAATLGDDVGKILGSAQGSDYTTRLGQQIFNPNYSDKQLTAVAEQMKSIINQKLDYYNQQFTQGTGASTSSASSGGQDMSAYAW